MRSLPGNRKIKGFIAVLLVITVLSGAALADTYRCIFNNYTITLDSSWKDNPNPNIIEGWFIRKEDKKISEGDFLIAKASQFLYLTPLFSDREELRFYNDVIYTGDVKTCYQDDFGLNPFYTSADISLKFGYGIKTGKSLYGADIISAKGGLYNAAVLKEEFHVETYKDLYNWIVEAGEPYLLGFYDPDLADEGFLLCVFTDAVLEDDSWNVEDMMLGLWTSSTAYSEVYLNEDSDLYRQAKEAYTALNNKKRLSYAHAMGLPTSLILGEAETTVRSDTESAVITFFPDGIFVYTDRRGKEQDGNWAFSEDTLTLSFTGGEETAAQGDPLVLKIGNDEFTLKVSLAAP